MDSIQDLKKQYLYKHIQTPGIKKMQSFIEKQGFYLRIETLE